MSDAKYAITLKSFSFPSSLGNEHANFRFALTLRFASEKGGLSTANSVIPSPETYWECDTAKTNDPRYVRMAGANEFDMSKISSWNATAFLIIANYLHAIQLTIIDVDRKDWWEKLGGITQTVLGGLTGAAKKAVPGAFADTTAAIGDQLQSLITKKIAGSDHDILTTIDANIPTLPKPGTPISVNLSKAGYTAIFEIIAIP